MASHITDSWQNSACGSARWTMVDGAVHEGWLALRNSQGQVLKHNLESLRSTRDLDVEVTMRALPFTPPVKLYLLNGTEALFAYYTVERREELIEGSPTELFDVLGSDSTLFRCEVTAGVRSRVCGTRLRPNWSWVRGTECPNCRRGHVD
ncbi:hypothetical protein [Streptomyces sp. NBC_01643]|uniref:hypothetical protein n=1 Tax=Streptomyces sp. NBC_01643 TaxID=2975906 RepID=UPI00386B1D2C